MQTDLCILMLHTTVTSHFPFSKDTRRPCPQPCSVELSICSWVELSLWSTAHLAAPPCIPGAWLSSEAQSEDSLALPPTRLPADVPGAPGLTAPKRQQGLSWGTHALRRAEGIADCPSRTGS